MKTSITTRFQVQSAVKYALRRPEDVSRRPQGAPKAPQGSQDGPKTAPRHPQDAPRTPPGRPKTPPRSGKFGARKRIFSGPPPNLDFGASWARFWEVLASILGGVLDGFKRIEKPQNIKKVGRFWHQF